MKIPMLGLMIAVMASTALLCQAKPEAAKAILRNARGQQIGMARFAEVRGVGVKIILDVSGLTPGPHGVHIHASGKCAPPGFESAGPHFNPEGKEHGLKNPKGPHAGDLENLVVQADGKAHLEILDPRLSLANGSPNSLFHPGGTAVVIHAGPDDQMTDPSGNSGARIACGVVTE